MALRRPEPEDDDGGRYGAPYFEPEELEPLFLQSGSLPPPEYEIIAYPLPRARMGGRRTMPPWWAMLGALGLGALVVGSVMVAIRLSPSDTRPVQPAVTVVATPGSPTSAGAAAVAIPSPTATATPGASPSPTKAASALPSATATIVAEPTSAPSSTSTAAPDRTATHTTVATATPLPATSTATATPTEIPSPTATPTAHPRPRPTPTRVAAY